MQEPVAIFETTQRQETEQQRRQRLQTKIERYIQTGKNQIQSTESVGPTQPL